MMTILKTQVMQPMPNLKSLNVRVVTHSSTKVFEKTEKWSVLSPHLKQHGNAALAYATLQEGLDYFITADGYLAFKELYHPVFAPRKKVLVFSDPICDLNNCDALLDAFLGRYPRAIFSVISERFAGIIRKRGFKVNSIGYEPELEVQNYNTKGNWNDLDMIRRARNEAKREKLDIREVDIESVNAEDFSSVTQSWISKKTISDHEIWLFARKPVFSLEPDVRKYVAYDPERKIVGYVFYDPMYDDGEVVGYSANIVRSDECRYKKLVPAIHMQAVDDFKKEGKKFLNLNLSPFVKLDRAKYNDDTGSKLFFKFSSKYGNELYNFSGLSFHKSKYRAQEKDMYLATNSWIPSNDVFLAFAAADIANGYFATMFTLLKGVLKGSKKQKP